MTLAARASAKQTKSAYHGLTPNKSAMTRPTAGYQATNPIREMKMTSGRFSNKYSRTKKRDRSEYRTIWRCQCMNTAPAKVRQAALKLEGGPLPTISCSEAHVVFFRVFEEVAMHRLVPTVQIASRYSGEKQHFL